MQNCIVIINKNAGSSKKISFEKVEKCLGRDYRYTRCTIPGDELPDFDGFDAVAVCGGDGTLSSILEKIYAKPVTVFYFPVGTLNDKAKAQRYSHLKTNCPANDKKDGAQPIVVGKCYPAPNAANGQQKAEGEKTDFEQNEKRYNQVAKDGRTKRARKGFDGVFVRLCGRLVHPYRIHVGRERKTEIRHVGIYIQSGQRIPSPSHKGKDHMR